MHHARQCLICLVPHCVNKKPSIKCIVCAISDVYISKWTTRTAGIDEPKHVLTAIATTLPGVHWSPLPQETEKGLHFTTPKRAILDWEIFKNFHPVFDFSSYPYLQGALHGCSLSIIWKTIICRKLSNMYINCTTLRRPCYIFRMTHRLVSPFNLKKGPNVRLGIKYWKLAYDVIDINKTFLYDLIDYANRLNMVKL